MTGTKPEFKRVFSALLGLALTVQMSVSPQTPEWLLERLPPTDLLEQEPDQLPPPESTEPIVSQGEDACRGQCLTAKQLQDICRLTVKPEAKLTLAVCLSRATEHGSRCSVSCSTG